MRRNGATRIKGKGEGEGERVGQNMRKGDIKITDGGKAPNGA